MKSVSIGMVIATTGIAACVIGRYEQIWGTGVLLSIAVAIVMTIAHETKPND